MWCTCIKQTSSRSLFKIRYNSFTLLCFSSNVLFKVFNIVPHFSCIFSLCYCVADHVKFVLNLKGQKRSLPYIFLQWSYPVIQHSKHIFIFVDKQPCSIVKSKSKKGAWTLLILDLFNVSSFGYISFAISWKSGLFKAKISFKYLNVLLNWSTKSCFEWSYWFFAINCDS